MSRIAAVIFAGLFLLTASLLGVVVGGVAILGLIELPGWRTPPSMVPAQPHPAAVSEAGLQPAGAPVALQPVPTVRVNDSQVTQAQHQVILDGLNAIIAGQQESEPVPRAGPPVDPPPVPPPPKLPQPIIRKIEEVVGSDVYNLTTARPLRTIAGDSATLRFTLESLPDPAVFDNPEIGFFRSPVSASSEPLSRVDVTGVAMSNLEISVSGDNANTPFDFVFKSIVDDVRGPETSARPMAVSVADQSLAIGITGISSTRHLPPTAPSTDPVLLFDRFLRVSGSATANTRVHFALFRQTNLTSTTFEPVDWGASIAIGESGQWDKELMLPGFLEVGFKGSLIVRVESLDGRHRTATPLKIALMPIELGATPPGLTLASPVHQSSEPLLTNVQELAFQIDVNDAGKPGGTFGILLFDHATGKEYAVSPTAATTISVAPLGEGEHRYQAAYLQGSKRGPWSNEIVVHVDRTPPTAERVEPTNFATSREKNQLRVFFESSLRKTPAQAKFSLLGDAGGSPVISDAALDPDDPSIVVLSFDANILPDAYTLKITEEAVTDVYGNPSDRPFDFRIIRPIGDEVPLDVAGLPDATGPKVVYPEYTPFRKYPDGANPSDKVVTRVARLYYFRDAHRVAQIINRDAKSWNRHNSTMARQLADQASIFAKEHVDERRASERNAIRAAQAARQAEAAMETVQRELVIARQDLAAINGRIPPQELLVTEQTALVDSAAEQETALRNALTAAEGDKADNLRADLERVKLDREKLEQDLRADTAELKQLQDARTAATTAIAVAEDRVSATSATVQSLRQQELDDHEQSEQAQAREDRAVERQFRLEVAAAQEDPDTYAPGDPDSIDPVAQVSVSVIGEGLIQLRGPLKGVNIIRTMINEIDAPVGQVRVGVHTIQINGENGERMEEVAGRIGRYVDHSRFLTSQSAQMLRNAVVYVASEKATQIYATCPEGSQAERDQRYQDAFFGKDFIDELREMDSEFLHTGNKLIALHSMDSTSLASSLFLLGLASNETRMQILGVFESMVREKLPVDEKQYFDASDVRRWYHFKRFRFMADNAHFVSFRGYFDSTILGNDTMSPVQREFVRLAQIFKSRLITEIELKQRVIERTLIEERIGDYQDQLNEAARREREAQEALVAQQRNVQREQQRVLVAVDQISASASAFRTQSMRLHAQITEEAKAGRQRSLFISETDLLEGLAEESELAPIPSSVLNAALEKALAVYSDADWRGDVDQARLDYRQALDVYYTHLQDNLVGGWKSRIRAYQSDDESDDPADPRLRIEMPGGGVFEIRVDESDSEFTHLKPKDSFRNYVNDRLDLAEQYLDFAKQIAPQSGTELERLNEIRRKIDALRQRVAVDETKDPFAIVVELRGVLTLIRLALEDAARHSNEFLAEIDQVRNLLAGAEPDILAAHERWVGVRTLLLNNTAGDLKVQSQQLAERMDQSFQNLLQANLAAEFAFKQAEAARRPLDHKKFLDMLIDETEEKFIELVEGTRAHTAVIDDYVKRLMTALDDDFNTQFYEPAFRKVREQTYSCWDVELGQIEHTTVLTNNRMFAKVLPQATMEFDLPKRDIVIVEAMEAAQAAYQDYGALVGDPNFLAMTKLFSGQPTASVFDQDGTTPLVRDVLPGLPSQTDENLIIQTETGQPEFASQLEALIPDPAIYKFETGTGFEIRPVIQPDGQSVVFNFNYIYTTNIREPVRADEKHLGRVKRHFVNTDVQIGNYELREVSRYRVALKAARTSRGVPLLEDIPVAGMLFRPLPQAESSLQQNVILANTVIFPTLFDLMGLRWAPAVADLDSFRLQEDEFTFRNRMRMLKNEVYDYSSDQVDQFLRIPQGERRPDLYRPQEPIPFEHPNGYSGPGLNRQESQLREGWNSHSVPETIPHPREDSLHTAPFVPVNPHYEIPNGAEFVPPKFVPQSGVINSTYLPDPRLVPVPGASGEMMTSDREGPGTIRFSNGSRKVQSSFQRAADAEDRKVRQTSPEAPEKDDPVARMSPNIYGPLNRDSMIQPASYVQDDSAFPSQPLSPKRPRKLPTQDPSPETNGEPRQVGRWKQHLPVGRN